MVTTFLTPAFSIVINSKVGGLGTYTTQTGLPKGSILTGLWVYIKTGFTVNPGGLISIGTTGDGVAVILSATDFSALGLIQNLISINGNPDGIITPIGGNVTFTISGATITGGSAFIIIEYYFPQ